MLRNPQNTNLRLYAEHYYQDYRVYTRRGPLILEYLDLLELTVQRALHEYPRVFAFRCDLRFPKFIDIDPYLESNIVVERFFASFKAKIRQNRAIAKQKYSQVHDSSVRYVWAREIGRYERLHYHLLIFLNNDAFHVLGKYELGLDNMFNRMHEAWASALTLPIHLMEGIVNFPDNPCYYLRRGDQESKGGLFERASYLCKADTKFYGNGCHAFGASRC